MSAVRFGLFVLVACSAGPRTPPGQRALSNQSRAAEPIVVVALIEDHVQQVEVTKEALVIKHDIKLDSEAETVIWLDRERLIALDKTGQAYRITGARLERYQMPPKQAWDVELEDDAHRDDFPSRLTIGHSENGQVEMGSCAGYWQGDDDPCVTWAVATLGENLVVGEVVATTDSPTDPPDEPVTIDAPPGIELAIDRQRRHATLSCTAMGRTERRTWTTNEPCPFYGANTRWLSTNPPIVAFQTISDCGEGGPNSSDYALRACALTDVAKDTDTIVFADGLWAHRSDADVKVPGGAYGTWTFRSGERVIGVLGTSVPPLTRPRVK